MTRRLAVVAFFGQSWRAVATIFLAAVVLSGRFMVMVLEVPTNRHRPLIVILLLFALSLFTFLRSACPVCVVFFFSLLLCFMTLPTVRRLGLRQRQVPERWRHGQHGCDDGYGFFHVDASEVCEYELAKSLEWVLRSTFIFIAHGVRLLQHSAGVRFTTS